jgi:hypothetical protein
MRAMLRAGALTAALHVIGALTTFVADNLVRAVGSSLRGIDAPRCVRTEFHCRIARIGGQLRGCLFPCLAGLPIKWRGTSRRPIPDSWTSIEQRSSPFHLAGNRNAAHPVNSILNYSYTVLEKDRDHSRPLRFSA